MTEKIIEDLANNNSKQNIGDYPQETKKKKNKVKKIIIISSAILLSLIILFAIFHKKDNHEYSFVSVQKKNLIQTVSETGTIKSVNEIELNFLNSGKVDEILVAVGDRVSTSQILAKLDYSDLEIETREKQAQYEIAQANLNKLLSGARDYEIAIYKADVNQAETNYKSALKELDTIKTSVAENISQAKTNMNTGIDNAKMSSVIIIKSNITKAKTALDKIKTILDDKDLEDVFSVQDKSYLYKTQANYNSNIQIIKDTEEEINSAQNTFTSDDINQALEETIITLNKIFLNLNNCYKALENTITYSNFTSSDLNTYKTNISTQLTTISAAISNVENSKQTLNNTILNKTNAFQTANISGNQQITSGETKVNSNYEAWQIAKAKLEKLIAPPSYEDIVLAQAQVKQAQAALDAVKNKIEKSIIKAPINGQITKIDYEVGEQISPNKAIIYLLTDNNLEIDVDISETDINKVNPGNKVEISLDAFDNELKIPGVVYKIEPAETIIQDVTYYKTTIKFDSLEKYTKQIKPGMTANVVITTAQKNNVLVIPARAIIERNESGKFVRILENKKVKEIPISTGLYGNDALVEVNSGLKEGQKIISYIKTIK